MQGNEELRMETHQSLSLLLLFLSYLLACNVAQLDDISRKDFPPDFIFGAASAAYQYEGATDVDGRKPSIWDTFTKDHPEKIADHSSGKIADEFYYRYKSDIKRLKETGFDSFRFSISWSRVLPNGRKGDVNHKGVEFYTSLIETLIHEGIEPIVTIFHWDLPQALEDEYGGFLSPKFVDDYLDYADFCFKTFGHKVKKWITFNEPIIFTTNGYEFGTFAPGRCSRYYGNCTSGNSGTEPYIVIHHLILAHAKAVDLYRKKHLESQKGIIGITMQSLWPVPKFYTPECCLAAYRAIDFGFGWVFHPVTFGDYPETMKSLVGGRLPKFNESESKLIKGSYDFLGLNYYTARYAEDSNVSCLTRQGPLCDSHVNFTTSKNGVPIGKQVNGTWMFIYPKGIEELLLYVKENYNNPIIYITENGLPDPLNSTSLNDTGRIDFYRRHLRRVSMAIKAGVKVKGFYIWTLLDDFEWNSGYTYKFGIYQIERENHLARMPKESERWFRQFLKVIPRVLNDGEPTYSVLSTA